MGGAETAAYLKTMTTPLKLTKCCIMARGYWTDEENDVIVADYFAMLANDVAGRPYSKVEHIRALQASCVPARGVKSVVSAG